MSLELAVVRYPGRTHAESAYGVLRERAGSDARWIDEVALVEHGRHDRMVIHGTIGGHFVDVNEMDHVSQPGAAKGAAAGMLLGTLLGGPAGLAPGIVIGAAVGGSAGAPDEFHPEPPSLTAYLRETVPEGSSAIVLLAESEHVDEMLDTIGPGADLRRREISERERELIEREIAISPAASPGPALDGEAPPSSGEITAA
jgi:uncharacterized membrane protein